MTLDSHQAITKITKMPPTLNHNKILGKTANSILVLYTKIMTPKHYQGHFPDQAIDFVSSPCVNMTP